MSPTFPRDDFIPFLRADYGSFLRPTINNLLVEVGRGRMGGVTGGAFLRACFACGGTKQGGDLKNGVILFGFSG